MRLNLAQPVLIVMLLAAAAMLPGCGRKPGEPETPASSVTYHYPPAESAK